MTVWTSCFNLDSGILRAFRRKLPTAEPPIRHRLRPCLSIASRKASTTAAPPPNPKASPGHLLPLLSFRGGPRRRPSRSSFSASRPPLPISPPLPPRRRLLPNPRHRNRGRMRRGNRRQMRRALTPSAAIARPQRPPSSPAGPTNHLCSRRLESVPSSRYRLGSPLLGFFLGLNSLRPLWCGAQGFLTSVENNCVHVFRARGKNCLVPFCLKRDCYIHSVAPPTSCGLVC
jgi:hypothetical protein